MLSKLLKYDLKWMIKIVCIYYVLGIIFAVLGRIFSLLPDSLIFNIIEGICKGAALSLVITGLINSVIRAWVRMVTNMYKDESYLTHTLPIDIKMHFLSKVLSVLIMVLLSVVAILSTVFIMYYSKENLEILKTSINLISSGLDVSTFAFIFLVTVVVMLEIIYIVFVGFLGITIGHSFNNAKLGKSFLFGIIIYFGCNVISMFILLFGSIFSNNLFNAMFKGSEVEYGLLVTIMIVAIVLYSIYNVVIYLLTNKLLSKGVNVD